MARRATIKSDAGICILSVPADAGTAAKLADSIRAYKLPRGVTVPSGASDYRNIVLDCGGEPLDEAAADRLARCGSLVVLCSPDTKSSVPIIDRLTYFKHSFPARDITPVLVKGEPADSLPDFFFEKKMVSHIMPDMSVVEWEETIEPVAADLRADSGSRWREMLRYETVRIVASVLGLHQDDLEQRHLARKRRAIAAMLVMAGSVFLTAAGIFLRLGFVAKKEGDSAREHTLLSTAILRRTMKELPASFAGDEEALFYVNEAMDEARATLEELGLGEMLNEVENGGGS